VYRFSGYGTQPAITAPPASKVLDSATATQSGL
jgi:hypothetical protein